LPPEVFNNPDFKRALNNFFPPDGKAVRLIISHRGDPATPGATAAGQHDAPAYGPRPLVRSLLGEGEDAKTVLGDGEAKTAPLPKTPSQ
jgi:hypothetical protein